MSDELIQGWKAIEDFVKLSRPTCLAKAIRKIDPMPIRKLHGGIYARHSELSAWLKRQDRSLAECYNTDTCNDDESRT